MVRFYYTDSNYIEVNTKTPTVREEVHNQINFIPYSTKNSIINQGFIKRIDFDIDFKDETSFNSFMAVVGNVIKISLDAMKFYYATYDGVSFQRVGWAGVFSATFSFVLQGLQYSLTERNITANLALPNTGNYQAEAVFTVSGGGFSIFKISDGIREITYTGTVSEGKTLIIQNWKAYVDGEEFSQNLSGDYPLIPANQVNFQFIITGTSASNVLVKYRDTWR
ncbi:MAG: hypothetical protein GX452_04470 [Ignavibacteriales bacterium]|nr:hypothetical protein [Ignavibacteriales bacterium]